MAILLAEILGLIWWFKYLPMVDMPEHMLAAQVLTHYDAPGSTYPAFFTRKFPWAPYSSYFLFALSMKALLGVINATRLYLSLTFILTIVSFWWWIRESAPGRDAQVIPATLLLFGYFFYVGVVNFLLSLPFLFFALIFARKLLNEERFSRLAAVGLAASLLLVYLSHIVSFVFCGIVLLCQVALAVKWRRIVRLIPSALPALGLLAFYALTQMRQDVSSTRLTWDPFKERLATLLLPFNIWKDFQEHKWFLDWPFLVIWIGVVVIAVVARLRYRQTSSGPIFKLREPAIITLVLLSSTLLFPSLISDGLAFALRGSYFAAFTALVLLPIEWDQSAILRWGMVIVCTLSPALMAARCTIFASEMTELENAIRYIPPAMVIQPIITEPHSAAFRTYPFHHAATWYSYYRGGVNPYLAAAVDWARHFPVRTRQVFVENPPGEWNMQDFVYASNQAGTDYFLVRSRNEKILADLRQHVPLAGAAGEWEVFGPNPSRK